MLKGRCFSSVIVIVFVCVSVSVCVRRDMQRNPAPPQPPSPGPLSLGFPISGLPVTRPLILGPCLGQNIDYQYWRLSP